MKCPQCGKEQPDSNLLCANPGCNVDLHSLARVKRERAEAAQARAAAEAEAKARETEEKALAEAASASRRNTAKDLLMLLGLCLLGLAGAVAGGFWYATRSDTGAAARPSAQEEQSAGGAEVSTLPAVSTGSAPASPQ